MHNLKKVSCVGVAFLDSYGRILLEDRRKISKHEENWSFFGGTMQKNEDRKEALIREIREELSYALNKYKFFKKYSFFANKSLYLTYYMYFAPVPVSSEIKVHKGASYRLFTFNQIKSLRMTRIDKKIINDISKQFKRIRQMLFA